MDNSNLEDNRRNLAKILQLPEDAKGAELVQKMINLVGHELTMFQLLALAHTCDLDVQFYVIDRAGDVEPVKL